VVELSRGGNLVGLAEVSEAEVTQRRYLHDLLVVEASALLPVLEDMVVGSAVASVAEEDLRAVSAVIVDSEDPVAGLATKEAAAASVDKRRQMPLQAREVAATLVSEVADLTVIHEEVQAATVNPSGLGIVMVIVIGETVIARATAAETVAETVTETAIATVTVTESVTGMADERTRDGRDTMKTTHTMTRVPSDDTKHLPFDRWDLIQFNIF
jgi:hypothetical protein